MNLKNVSDEALVSKTFDLVKEEKRITLEILHHFMAIEDRLIFTREGYSSLFEMAVKKFQYTEAQAHRRISAARLLRQMPSVEVKVKTGVLHVSQLAQVQTFFRSEKKESGRNYTTTEKENLLLSLEGKSARETARLLLDRSPALQLKKTTEERLRVVTPELTEIRFTLDAEGLALLEEAKALFAHSGDMNPGTADLLKKGLALLIEKKKKGRDLKVRTEISSEAGSSPVSLELPPIQLRAATSNTRVSSALITSKVNPSFESGTAAPRSRFIPQPLKRFIYTRAEQRCEYFSVTNGRQCESNHALEVHHEYAFAKGGEHTAQNLRVLCRAHNAALGEQEFGRRYR